MARARNIKPGLYKNEDLAECSIWARYLFPGLWMLADREGRLEDRPKRIKAELLPFDSADVNDLLNELGAHKFLVRYRNQDGSFIQIAKFKEHQSPHYSEKPSVIKPPIFPECSCLEGGITPGVLQECSESHPVLMTGEKPPDSLIPDSLIPSKDTLSGEAPDLALVRVNGFRHTAAEILTFLNDKTHKRFRPVDATLKPIIARLKEGFTADDCRAVIAAKCRQWTGNERMDEFLRPKTLFCASNFANYEGALGAVS